MKSLEKLEIKKENIVHLSFPIDDVIDNINKQHIRLEKLKQAMVTGNALKHKVKIYFVDEFDRKESKPNKVKFVYTTVWFVSEKHVVLKGGIIIPINSIVDVEL